MFLNDSFEEPSSFIPDLCGIVIKGRLRLTKIIGRGTWGIVYRAQDIQKPELEYAVKCMLYGEMPDKQRRCVSHEVKLHKFCSARSENVLQFCGVHFDEDSGMLYIITELCEDCDAMDHILDWKYIGNTERVRRTFLDLLDGLETCHELGVYHRDLKPENIFLKKDGKAVVGDFGFATTKPKTKDFDMGSVPFMAPEICRGIPNHSPKYISSPHADIWALGGIFMNLVTGCNPWDKAATNDQGFVEFLKDRNRLLRRFPISRETNEILKSIYRINPAKRTSISDLRERVRNAGDFYDRESLKEFIRSMGMETRVTEPHPTTRANEPTTTSNAAIPLVPAPHVSATRLEPVLVVGEDVVGECHSDESDTSFEEPSTPSTQPVDVSAISIDTTAEVVMESLDAMTAIHPGDVPAFRENVYACVPPKSPNVDIAKARQVIRLPRSIGALPSSKYLF